MKTHHEIRDPIHTFILVDSDERKVIDSPPVQRLRHIHQLALTSLVYPGATHKRFEHSLGVMDLATRIFDTVTREENIQHESVRSIVRTGDQLRYWRRVLRIAALCHDIGHLPFSHAAEDELLPEGWDHERITASLISSSPMKEIWNGLEQPLRADDILKLAVGPKKAGVDFSEWEAILAEIIVGDAFGADRIDYLLRDSHHAGVAYGGFDHHRLIGTLRILPQAGGSSEPALGIEEGGLHSAEALLLARYFMYTQVYFHPVRRIYDQHLKDFLREWTDGAGLPTDMESHLSLTDHEVYSAILDAARNPHQPGHEPARRIVERDHFKEVYRRTRSDIERNPEAAELIVEALTAEFGAESIRSDSYRGRGGATDFPVVMPKGRIISSIDQSDVLKTVPPVAVDYVFALPERREEITDWLTTHREKIIPPVGNEEASTWS